MMRLWEEESEGTGGGVSGDDCGHGGEGPLQQQR